MPWTPGRRSAALALEEPFDDVPDHLWAPLWSWFENSLRDTSGYLNTTALFTIGIDMRIPFADPRDGYGDSARDVLKQEFSKDRTRLLDAVEWVLGYRGYLPGRKVDEIAAVLEIGNSAYAVSPDGDALQMRVEPSVQQQVADAVANAVGSAGDHLASAWNNSYGRTHDAPKAYSEAIKAIEAAAAPIVSPKNAKATLGTMIADVRQKPGKWLLEVAVPDGMTTVADMMDLIWKGQTSRHGGLAPTREETPDEARAAVHLAATLVQWFSAGSVRPAT